MRYVTAKSSLEPKTRKWSRRYGDEAKGIETCRTPGASLYLCSLPPSTSAQAERKQEGPQGTGEN